MTNTRVGRGIRRRGLVAAALILSLGLLLPDAAASASGSGSPAMMPESAGVAPAGGTAAETAPLPEATDLEAPDSSEPTGLPVDPPQVIPRSHWGALDPQCEWPIAERVQHVVLHHTSDSGPDAESLAAIRAIQRDHMNNREWCDIGYNFLVDSLGNIYEGAAGSIALPVVAAHTKAFNYGGVGIGMLGNYSEIAPSDAMLEAVANLAGWKLGWFGVEPESEVRFEAGETSVIWPPGTQLRGPAILGHGSFYATECPGAAAEVQIPRIRAAAAQVAAAMQTSGQFGEGLVALAATPNSANELSHLPEIAGGPQDLNQTTPASGPGLGTSGRSVLIVVLSVVIAGELVAARLLMRRRSHRSIANFGS